MSTLRSCRQRRASGTGAGCPDGQAAVAASQHLPGLDAPSASRPTFFTPLCGSSGPLALGGAPRKARLPRWGAPFHPGLRPGLHCGLRLGAGRADLPRPRGVGTSASQRPQRGSRASRRRPGLRPPPPTGPLGRACAGATRCPDGAPFGRLRRRCWRYGGGSPQRPAVGRTGLRPPGLAPALRLPIRASLPGAILCTGLTQPALG